MKAILSFLFVFCRERAAVISTKLGTLRVWLVCLMLHLGGKIDGNE